MELKQLMQQSALHRSVVLAGEKGLERTVSSVNMMDAPDILAYLEKEQLLLTTGYSIKEDPERLIDIIIKMNELGCAGLGIKSKRFLGSISQEAVEKAESLNFPLLELPQEISLGQLVHETLALVLKSREAELYESKRFHEKLSRLLHREDGLLLVMRELEKKLRAEVNLIDVNGEVLYTRTPEQVPQQLREAELAESQRTSGGKRWAAYPVETGGSQNGILLVYHAASDKGLSSLLISQAANVISFELMKLAALGQHERMMKNAFFNDVLEENFSTNAEIISRGKYYGLEEETLYLTAVAQLDTTAQEMTSERALFDQKSAVYGWLDKRMKQRFPSCVLFTKGELFVMLVGINFFREEVEQHFLEEISELQDAAKEKLGAVLSFGVGNVAYQMTDISRAWQESVEALHAGLQLYKGSFIQTSRTKGMKELLEMTPEENRRSFISHQLQPILSLENKKEKDGLLLTLKVFLAEQGHIAQTAEALGIHRNTVLFRIRKCEELLGLNVKDPDASLSLRLALYLRDQKEIKLQE